MSAGDRRRVEDIRRLRDLARSSDGRIRVERVDGEPPRSVQLRLQYRTVRDETYPRAVENETLVRIDFPPRYPMTAPKATITTPIFHPNVYTSGLICLGDTWMASETLDALVRRIIRLVTYDPLVTGGEPPANRTAMLWYRRARDQHPTAFPTEHVRFAGAQSKTTSGVRFDEPAAPERVRVNCSQCGKGLMLPAGKSGMVRCPTCAHRFKAST